MIYLDNAATSWPKPEKVYDDINRCMREYCANPGRGGHAMSIASGRAVINVRELLARFFNIKNPMHLCFTKNTTEAINIAIKGIINPGDHIITTCMEHNSVIRPLKTLEKYAGIELMIVKGNEYGEVDPHDVKNSIKKNTKLIVCTLSSNVNGVIMPVREIGRIAREHGVLFLVDAAQGAGSIPVDVEEMNIDMLAFPGHKGLLGPQGTGGLYVADDVRLRSFMEGGTGSNSENIYQPEIMPDFLESGTLNTPGIVGLGAGVEFINSFGLNNIRLYKHMILSRLLEGLEEIRNVKIYSKKSMENNSGIAAINFENTDSSEISNALDSIYGIATRPGLHCSPLAHETLGTLKQGIVRFSPGCFNTVEEVDLTLEALREISVKL